MRALILAILLLSTSGCATAAPTTRGYVAWELFNDGLAGIGNSAGNALAFAYSPRTERYNILLDVHTSCTEGDAYFSLVNSDGGSIPVEWLCNDTNILFVTARDYPMMKKVLEEGSFISIASFRQSGRIASNTFSLVNSKDSMLWVILNAENGGRADVVEFGI